ncbi:MAG: helix-turn-helix domain-containing protein [Streptosporangiaceae bacterium]
MERGNEWSVRVARDVGRRLAYFRGKTGLTASALSQRCAERGLPLDRNVIAKLETGHRQSVTLDEVLVLAAALGVPPGQLVFGVGLDRTVEVLPGHEVAPYRGLQWFSGEATLPLDARPDRLETWIPDGGPAFPLLANRLNDLAARDEMSARNRALEYRAQAAADPARGDALRGLADSYLVQVERHRADGETARRGAESDGWLPPARITQYDVMRGEDAS